MMETDDRHIEKIIDSMLDDNADGKAAIDESQAMADDMAFLEDVVEATHRSTVAAPDIDDAWAAFKQQHEDPRRNHRWIWWAAASVAILIAAAGLTLWHSTNGDSLTDNRQTASTSLHNKTHEAEEKTDGGTWTANAKIITTKTEEGEIKTVVLPDGTEVCLNELSTIRYPEQFAGKERVVTIAGEAYLKVTHNAKMPFVVRHGSATTRVLGTEFNVRSREGMESHVTLVSGKVEVTSGNMTKTLTPDQDACIGSEGITVTDVNPLQFTGWHKGIVYFDDATLDEVMDDIGERYGMNVIFREKGLADMRFHCMYSVTDSLGYVLDIIKSSSEVEITVKGNTIFVE